MERITQGHEYQEVGVTGATLKFVCQTIKIGLSSRQLEIYDLESRGEVQTRNVNVGIVAL